MSGIVEDIEDQSSFDVLLVHGPIVFVFRISYLIFYLEPEIEDRSIVVSAGLL